MAKDDYSGNDADANERDRDGAMGKRERICERNTTTKLKRKRTKSKKTNEKKWMSGTYVENIKCS